jgi:hypothetical protein
MTRQTLALLGLCILTTLPVLGQHTFPGTTVAFENDLYIALEKALEAHQGDILILFYRPGDHRANGIAATLLNDASLRSFLEVNFTLCAVEIGSAEWARLQHKYRPGAEADWPYVVVDIRRFLSHAEFHGWENGPGMRDPLELLEKMKRQGEIQGDVRDWKPVKGGSP